MANTMMKHLDTAEHGPDAQGGGDALRVLEAAALLLGFSGLLYAVMRPESGWSGAVVSGGVIAAGLVLLSIRRNQLPIDVQRLWLALFALAAGFWVFNALRRGGIAEWPVHPAFSRREYATLLYMHFALLMTMAAAMAWAVYRIPKSSHLLRWGSWRRDRVGRLGQAALVVSAVGVWVWAGATMIRDPLGIYSGIAFFVGIAFLKSAMAALIEEGCYRGVILPLASARFSVAVAIVLQACMYAVFHAFLTPGALSAGSFVAVAFGLGLLFGTVSYVTNGIGWACLTHSAVSMVIEWQNLP